MKTKVKAITSVMHGRHHLQPGEELEVTKGDADEMVKAGLVQVVDENEAAPAQVADEADVKMDDEPQNKMEPAPENKASGKKSTSRKAD